MNVIFEVHGRGISFSIGVNRLERVLNIKQKVQNLFHLPISHQIFIFNGQPLQDDLPVWTTAIDRGSRIVLIVATAVNLPPPPIYDPYLPPQRLPTPEFPPNSILPSLSQQLIPYQYDVLPTPLGTLMLPMPAVPPMQHKASMSYIKKLEEVQAPSDKKPSPASQLWRVMVSMKVPNWKDRIPVEADWNGTVLKLKKRILGYIAIVTEEDMVGVTAERMVLQTHSTRVKLLDHQVLNRSAVTGDHEIDVFIRKQPLPVAGAGRNSSGMLKVKVFSERGGETHAEENVSVLMREQFSLSDEASNAFIQIRQANSFQSHKVNQVDTMETLDGYVSAESSTSSNTLVA
ncbi:hypothetical protein VNO78_19309 [Psophocarpus tetragonolobus]|uniref:Ubiquitin-like domain-containing protein n=1 Tax=Psophocarpus tetragonolobus TaxID=3891 RepID=A0AAN9S7G7_PSOTE